MTKPLPHPARTAPPVPPNTPPHVAQNPEAPSEQELKEAVHTVLDWLGEFDEETGFYKKARFESALQDRLQKAHDKQCVGVMKVALADLRQLADSLGNGAMESLLAALSAQWRPLEQEQWLVGRLSQDRFIFATPLCNDMVDVIVAAEALEFLCTQPLTLGDMAFTVPCSMGVAVYPDHGDTPAVLLERARLALLHAQSGNTDRFCFYDKVLGEAALQDNRLAMDLRRAITQSQFEVLYQPVIELRTGAVQSVEAGLRWSHPELGFIRQERLFSIAEKGGQMAQVGDWLLARALSDIAPLANNLGQPLSLSVPLSSIQLKQSALPLKIKQHLRSSGVAPERLILQIHEGRLPLEDEALLHTLHALRDLGVRLALDQFGCGHSSLFLLRQGRIGCVKIAPHFIDKVATHAEDNAVVKAMVSMCHHLRVQVCAHGLSSVSQQRVLVRMGCDSAQGSLFVEPAQLDILGEWLGNLASSPVTLTHDAPLHENKTLLLVDDEPNVLNALKRLLRKDGYTLLSTTSPQEAFELLATHDVGVILSDQRMPEMSGTAFLSQVKALYPNTVRLVLSGYTELQSVTDAINQGAIYKFLTKPWDDEQLRANIREAFARLQMQNENTSLHQEVDEVNTELIRLNHMLEQRVLEKNERIARDVDHLHVLQEMINEVAVPVIGVDNAADIVVANRMAHELFKTPGKSLIGMGAQCLPSDVCNAVQDMLMDFDPRPEKLFLEYQQKHLQAVIAPMGKDSLSRGVLITFIGFEDHAL